MEDPGVPTGPILDRAERDTRISAVIAAVLFDRTGFTSDLPPPTGPPPPSLPTADQFRSAVEEFCFETTQIPIYINCGEPGSRPSRVERPVRAGRSQRRSRRRQRRPFPLSELSKPTPEKDGLDERLATVPQRRALAVRDGGLRVPRPRHPAGVVRCAPYRALNGQWTNGSRQPDPVVRSPPLDDASHAVASRHRKRPKNPVLSADVRGHVPSSHPREHTTNSSLNRHVYRGRNMPRYTHYC